jgi:hypothetical protein
VLFISLPSVNLLGAIMPDPTPANVLAFGFSLVADRQVALTHRGQSRRLSEAELEQLVVACNQIYYRKVDNRYLEQPEAMVALGQTLFDWLDGAEGWLRSCLGQGRQEVYFELAQSWERTQLQPRLQDLMLQVAHLPWELLHDGHGYLLSRGMISPPVRVVVNRAGEAIASENRPLQMLFMATSPTGVTELNHEQEEVNILDATDKQPLLLVTEESGCVGELGNLVQSYEAGYFDVFNLTGHGIVYREQDFGNWLDRMDPRPVLAENTPCFVTEDDFGNARFSTVKEFAGAFGARFPKVIFLSGCHTGQVIGSGAGDPAVPSMAQQLVLAGADVVLGWARPVFDLTGILAAAVLYQSLSIGDSVTIAVQKTVAALLQKFEESGGTYCSDWHLLRVYRSTRAVSALVTPLNTAKRPRLKRSEAAQAFLGSEPVAGLKEFVGRRRVLQRSLRALQVTDPRMGVFLHGMGGLGKSSICARLCDRIQAQRPDYRQVVIYGVVSEAILLASLEMAYGDCEGVTEALNSKLKLAGRLQNFFEDWGSRCCWCWMIWSRIFPRQRSRMPRCGWLGMRLIC